MGNICMSENKELWNSKEKYPEFRKYKGGLRYIPRHFLQRTSMMCTVYFRWQVTGFCSEQNLPQRIIGIKGEKI